MPGHDFEHKVQQKMEELRLTPSRAVWDGVEAEINRDKKRRRLVFILPLLVLLLGSGAFWWASQEPSSNLITEKKQKENDSKITHGATTNAPLPESGDTGKNPGKPDHLISEEENQVNKREKDLDRVTNETITNSPDKTGVIAKEKINKKTGLARKKDKPRVLITDDRKSKAEKSLFTKPGEFVKQTNKRVNQSKIESGITEDKLNVVDEDAEKSSEPGEVVYAPSKTNRAPFLFTRNGMDSLVKLPIIASYQSPAKTINRKKSNWQWGFSSSAGVSKNVQGGFFNAFEKSLVVSADMRMDSGFRQTPYGFSSRQPATVRAGYNYSLGVFVQRKLSRKLELSAALQYNYFSTRYEVGTKVDANAFNSTASPINAVSGTYYLDGKGQQHINAYHFVELPLTLRIKLNNSRQLPLYWSNGLSLAYMVNTSALHYESRFGYYYKNDNLFQKMQWGVHTGLSVRLFNRTNHPLELGPHVNFQFSNLLKSANPDTRHLLGGGLMLRWYMKD